VSPPERATTTGTDVDVVLAPFVATGVFGSAEVQIARTVARLHHRPLVGEEVLALAVAARAPRLGHVGVEVHDVAERIVGDERADRADRVPLPWPDPDRWAAVLAASDLVHRPGDALDGPLRPLAWDAGRLYLHRYHRYEVDVAADLDRRSRPGGEPTGEPVDAAAAPGSAAVLDGLFPAPADGSEDRQRRAAEAALAHPVTVIAGGPGTGKTRTIARLLAAALGDPGSGVRDVALAAPTGKAAARMTEAVHAAVAETEADGVIAPAVAERLRAVEATTIHALLGLRPGGRVTRDRHRPLAQDLVVIDETSMVALPLLARLLDAIRPGTRVVFVGDPDQLASVEAGTVLADLVGPSRSPGPATAPGPSGAAPGSVHDAPGPSGAAEVARAAPGPMDAGAPPAVEPPRGPLAGRVTVLDRVHRFGAASGIAELADAIRRGDAPAALALLDGSRDDLALVPPEGAALDAVVAEAVAAGIATVEAARRGRALDALDAAGRVKVLAARHRGANGRLDWTRRIEAEVLGAVEGLDRRGGWYPGRPVLVTGNDRLNRVFNGDTGVAISPPDGGPFVVALPDARSGEGHRTLPTARLGDVETWWAMTIHKSQGSEFPHVVVALPADATSPVLTRELLYTAVTRARSRVTVVASPEVVRAAIERPVARASGLGTRLWS